MAAVALTFAPTFAHGTAVGCCLLFGLAVARTFGVLPKRIVVDSRLRRRGIRLS